MHTEISALAAALAVLVAVFLSARNLHPQFALAFAGLDDHQPEDDQPKAWESLVMFKKGGGSAPAADPNVGKAALKEAELGEEWLKFSKQQFAVDNARQAEQDKLASKVTQQQLDAAAQAQGWAKEDRDRYNNTFKPMQDEFINTANNWDSAERQQQQAAEAKADVMSNAAQQRGATQRQMASMGVSPTSGRFAGVDRAGEMGTTLAAAGAENTARNQVRKEGVAMRGEAINLGSGLGINPATSLGLSTSANSAAYGTTAANNQQAANLSNKVGQGYQSAMSGYNSQAGILQGQYNSQLSAWQSKQANAAANTSGLMSGIGSIAGMGLVAF